MNIHSYFFLTVKVSRATDYDEGYSMLDQQTQTVTNCGCYKKAPVYGSTWDDDVLWLHRLKYKKNEIEERGKVVEFSNQVYIPTGEDAERLR